MGKKRRYINRTQKFAKKAFRFLDKLDGTQDSKLLSSKIDTILSKITVTDRKNQTMSLQFEGTGPGTGTQAAGLEKDRVVYKVDGVTVHTDGIQTFAAASGQAKGNRSRYKTTKVQPALMSGNSSAVLLATGSHTIEAHIIGEAAAPATATITVKAGTTAANLDNKTLTLNPGGGAVEFTIVAAQAALLDGTNIGLDNAANVNDIAAKIVGGLEAHAIAITATDASGAAGNDEDHAILLTQDAAGAAGNTAIASTAADDKLVANGEDFSGGFDADDAVKSETLSKTFSILRSHPGLAFDTGAIVAADNGANPPVLTGQVNLDLTKITVANGGASGKRPGEESNYDPTQAGAKDGYEITAVDSEGQVVSLVAAKAVRNDGAARADTTGILSQAVGAGTSKTITFTFTPKASDNSKLEDDAISTTLTVTVPAP